MIRRIVIAALVFFPVILWGQGKIQLEVSVDNPNGSKASGAKVEIMSGKGSAGSGTTDARGMVIKKVDWNETYTVIISKAGFATKKIVVDATGIHPDDIKSGDQIVKFNIDLLKKDPKFDYSVIEDEPVGWFYYDESTVNIEEDEIQNKRRKKKIDKFLEELAAQQQEEDSQEDEMKANQEAADKLVSQGGAMLDAGNLDGAKAKFQAALDKVPDHPEAKSKLQEVEQKIREKQEEEVLRKKFDEQVRLAEAAVQNNKKETAIDHYTRALGIIDDAQVKAKRDQLQKELDQEAAAQKEYEKFMNQGRDAMSQSKWDDAIAAFDKALGVKPGDAEATSKKKQAQDAKAEEERNAAAMAAKKEEAERFYQSALTKVGQEDYQGALADLGKALQNDPTMDKASQKKIEIEDLLEAQREAQAAENLRRSQYDNLMAAGEAKLQTEEYDKAKDAFQQASQMYPDEQLPKDKIQQIEQILANKAEYEAKKAQYTELMRAGDQANASKDYEQALAKYKEARDLMPGEEDPRNKIREIEELLAKQKSEQELEARYTAAVDKADGLFAQEKWSEAITAYREALDIKPGGAHPTQRITEAQDKIKEKERLAEVERRFNNLVQEGDQASSQKNYQIAADRYEAALEVKDDAQVRAKREEMLKLIQEDANAAKRQAEYDAFFSQAEQHFASEAWTDAIAFYDKALGVMDKQEAKDRKAQAQERIDAIAREKEKLQRFNSLITEADALKDQKKYVEAKGKLQEADAIMPNEPEVSNRLSALDALIAADAETARKQEKFDQAFNRAEDAFNAGKWDDAIAAYNEALEVFPGHERAQARKAEAKLRKEQEANSVDEERYLALVNKGDNAFEAGKWNEAETAFKEALKIKNEQHPQQMLARIAEARLAQEQADQEATMRRQRYDELMAKGAEYVNKRSYEQAISAFKEAKGIAVDPSIPQARMDEAQKLLDEQRANEGAEEQFLSMRRQADALFEEAKYQEAIDKYNEVLGIRDDAYSRGRIIEAEKRIAQADEDKIAVQFTALVKEADKLYKVDKSYREAQIKYQEAKRLRNDDSYVNDMLAELQQIMDDLEKQEELSEEEQKYQNLINRADGLFKAGLYRDARMSYGEAYNLKPNAYPKQRIEECEKKEAQAEDMKVKLKSFDKLIAKADKAFDEEDYEDSRRLYRRSLEFNMNNSPWPQSQLDKIQEILEEDPVKEITLRDIGEADPNMSALDVDALIRQGKENQYNRTWVSLDEVDNDHGAYLVEEAQQADQVSGENMAAVLRLQENLIDTYEEDEALRKYNSQILLLEVDTTSMYHRDWVVNDQQRSTLGNDYITVLDEDISRTTFDGEEMRKEGQRKLEIEEDEIGRADHERIETGQTASEKNQAAVKTVLAEQLEQSEEETLWLEANREELDNVQGDIDVKLADYESLDQVRRANNKQEVDILVAKQNAEYALGEERRQDNTQILEKKDEDILLASSERNTRDEDASLGNQNKVDDAIEKSMNHLSTMDVEIRDENEVAMNSVETDIIKEDRLIKSKEDINTAQTALDMERVVDETIARKKDESHKQEKNEDAMQATASDIGNQNKELVDANEDRMMTNQGGVEAITEKNIAETEDGEEIQQRNQDILDHSEEVVQNESQERHQEQEDRVLKGQQIMDKNATLSPKDFYTEVANSLAQDFPQGVTETNHPITNEYGDLITAVTRRIVVNGEVGNVYERHAGRYGVTYYRNAQPISEYTWIKETEDATLKRN